MRPLIILIFLLQCQASLSAKGLPKGLSIGLSLQGVESTRQDITGSSDFTIKKYPRGIGAGIFADYFIDQKNGLRLDAGFGRLIKMDYVMTPFPTDELSFDLHEQVFVTHNYIGISYLRKLNQYFTVSAGLTINSTGINYFTEEHELGKGYNDTIGVGVHFEDYEDWKSHIQPGINLGISFTPFKKFNRLRVEAQYNNVFGRPVNFYSRAIYNSPYTGKTYSKFVSTGFYGSYFGANISLVLLKAHKPKSK
jgi:hypothetical protein